LEIKAQVKYKTAHWYQKDLIVADGVVQIPTHTGEHRHAWQINASQGSGSYYIKSWSFRRVGSKISSSDWIDKGGGNSQTY
jgi:hypothetical protein